MEIKKSKNADLESKRGWMLQLGFLVTGSLTLAAFTYQNPDALADMQAKVETRSSDIEYVLMQQPKETQNQQQQQQQQNDNQQTSSTVSAQQQANEQSSSTSNSETNPQAGVNVDLGNLLAGVNTKVGTGLVPVTTEDKIEDFPEHEAKFPGGAAAMQKFIQENLNYPQESLEWGEEGLVALTFVVEKDGSISNISISQGVSKELDREARRLVKMFPNWIPGESRYEKVRSRILLPIRFEIGK